MPNWIKLSDEKKQTIIADTLLEIESKYPFKYDEDFEVLNACINSINEGTFGEAHFRSLLDLPNGKNYWNIIRSIAIKGSVDERVLEKFEKKLLS